MAELTPDVFLREQLAHVVVGLQDGRSYPALHTRCDLAVKAGKQAPQNRGNDCEDCRGKKGGDDGDDGVHSMLPFSYRIPDTTSVE